MLYIYPMYIYNMGYMLCISPFICLLYIYPMLSDSCEAWTFEKLCSETSALRLWVMRLILNIIFGGVMTVLAY